MNKLLLVTAIAALVMTACDSPEENTPTFPEDNRQISPDFAGDWRGTASLSVGTAAMGDRSVQVSVQVEADGPALHTTISPICGAAEIVLHTTGNGRSAMWYGEKTCPVSTDACPNISVKYTSAILKVLDDGRFYSLLMGTATGCGSTLEASVEVYATK